MPRHSPFTVVLTKEERQELKSRVRKYTSPYRDVIRAKIVLMAAQGLSNDTIASRLDTPRQVVSKVAQTVLLGRFAGPRRATSGRATSPLFPPASLSK